MIEPEGDWNVKSPVWWALAIYSFMIEPEGDWNVHRFDFRLYYYYSFMIEPEGDWNDGKWAGSHAFSYSFMIEPEGDWNVFTIHVEARHSIFLYDWAWGRLKPNELFLPGSLIRFLYDWAWGRLKHSYTISSNFPTEIPLWLSLRATETFPELNGLIPPIFLYDWAWGRLKQITLLLLPHREKFLYDWAWGRLKRVL